jgi:MFS family permease
VIGPPLGGFITTYASWHWIFLINIPIGLLGIFMALRFIDPIKSDEREPFDLYGMVLAGLGLAGIAFGLSVAGLNLLPWTTVAALVVGGAISMTLYVIHARRTGSPVLDFSLLNLPTLRAAVLGGFLFRLGIGALPFLLPLLMQVGFGLSPFHSGLVTFGSSLGAMGMKTLAARIIRAFGFRNLMTVNAIVSAVFLAACALFTVTTPLLIIMIILVSVNQQLAVSAGVAVGAASVETTMWLSHVSELNATVFAPAFVVVALTSAASSWFFWQMPVDAGHEISGRKAVEIASRKGAAKSAATAAVKTATEDTQDMRDQRLG